MKLLNDAHLWVEMPMGIAEKFPAPNARPVTLKVNCSDPTRFFIEYLCTHDPHGRPVPQGQRFLAKIDGLDEIKFVTPGPYRVWHMEENSHVLILTRDGKLEHREAVDEEVFTQWHEGPIKDPAITAIEERVFARMERRLKLREAELERRYAERDVDTGPDNLDADKQPSSVGTADDTPPASDGGKPDETGG